MGLINNDAFEASNGVQKSGTYISFNNETLYLRKLNQVLSVPMPAPAPAPAPAPTTDSSSSSTDSSSSSSSSTDSSSSSSSSTDSSSSSSDPVPVVPVPEKKYAVNANYRIFWDKAARDAGKSFMELRSVSAEVPESALTTNLYEVLYNELKKQYPNSVDELTVR
jgi:hypothetical protein